ncbi:Lrp/AsnC family transcriptional regulator [Alcaligenaceae bacterium SJ-26]|nr:Lrp/AsnC family transcriptional regulator [Alcaligenaceae bacterium SJ-26]
MTVAASTRIELDDTDHRILALLQENSALTNQELAHLSHTSPATCLRRVRRLVETGVIARQVALLDANRIRPSLTAIVEITLDQQAEEQLSTFESACQAEAAIQQCYRVSQGPDFVLIIEVTDMPAYHALAHRFFTGQKNVRNVRTFFSINRAKFDTRIALTPPASATD